ncbi:MAG: outer membrane protein assembly factor BamD [Gemmatimonadota bacterium]|nr:outer membrane protein assembly factor BamD [Gemmatimonadota bacterium]
MRLSIVLSFVVVLGACSPGFQPRQFSTPESLMVESERYFRLGKCTDAILGFSFVTGQLPVRDFTAIRARFLLAECLFSQGQFLEAARQFRRVADEAPNHPLAPRALLRTADSQRQLWSKAELDPTFGQAAVVTYQEVMGRFPRTSVSRRAGMRVQALTEQFAEKEYKNGLYYLRFNAYDSAILYFKSVVTEYGRTRYAPLALVQLVAIYQELGYEEEETETCQTLRRFYADTEGVDRYCSTESQAP